MRQLPLRQQDQNGGNDLQFVPSHEACEFLQSGEATDKKLCDKKMQGLRLSFVLVLRHSVDAAEAGSIYVFSVSMATVRLRSSQTSVQPEPRLRQADLAMPSVLSVEVSVQITTHLRLFSSRGHAEQFCYVILRCGIAIAHVNIIHVT